MKQNLLLSLLLVVSSCLMAQTTIFVKHDAAGSNDGSSWQNAYTALHAAVIVAVPGDQIWVAAGSYTPDPGTANSSFTLLAGISLYGGFNGTETMLSARNPVTNVTTLSGDLAGNDVVGMFASNRADNSRHVIEVVNIAQPNQRAVVDGFTIRSGHTLVGSALPDLARRGGGILAAAALTVQNCRFTDNYGESGAGITATTAEASGLLVNNCVFENNEVTAQAGGVFMRDLLSGTVKNCTFRNNKTNRGTLYPFLSTDILIDSCLFENNDGGVNFCSGLFTWQSNFTLSNSTFKGNKASAATGAYIDGRDGGNLGIIENCLFENNTATNFGAGIYNWQGTVEVRRTTFRGNMANNAAAFYNDGREFDSQLILEDCLFDKNESLDYGGSGLYSWKSNYQLINTVFRANMAINAAAIYNSDSSLYQIKGCTFENGAATFGAAVANYGAGNTGMFDDCTFKNNTAVTSGGAMINGFTAQVAVENCQFEGNKARFGAGIFSQNDYTGLTVNGSLFSANEAEVSGGGINISSGIAFILENSRFELNSANTGGAVQISEDSLDLTAARIGNCVFSDNFALGQAAALDLNNAEVEISNCLFIKNLNLGLGAGGAIANNASANKTAPVKIVNSTFADNSALIGAGIAQWEDDNGGNATLELQNTVLHNLSTGGVDYEVEAGTPEVTSLGGNSSGDLSLATVLTATNDQLVVDPLFISPDFYDYHLMANSPCIDKGIAAGAPTLDLDGNPRKGAGPDQGCYEFQTIGTQHPNAQVLPLRLLPNPAVERSIIVVENEWSGDVQVRVTAPNGALVRSFATSKPAGRWVQPLEVHNLPAGVYSIQVWTGTAFYEGSLVKR